MLKKNFRFISLIQLTLLSALILSCGGSSTRVGHPVYGVTRRFPIPAVGREAKLKPYDFTQLQEGKGLYVFSYEITYQGPDREVPKTSTGIRIWEHDFHEPVEQAPKWKVIADAQLPDTVTKSGLIPVCRNFEGLFIELFDDQAEEAAKVYQASAEIVELTDKYRSTPIFPKVVKVSNYAAVVEHLIGVFSGHAGPKFEMRYRRGRLVYGGHVWVNGVGKKLQVKVTDCFIDDIRPIQERFADQLEGIEIITDLMTFPPPPASSDSTSTTIPSSTTTDEWE